MSKMIQNNIKNKKNKMTILSIKGTSFRLDMFLDIQLYFGAILINLINTFSTLAQEKEEYTFKLMEYGLSIPYKILFQYFIIDKHLVDLIDTYEYNEKITFMIMLLSQGTVWEDD